jgi:hypothetical protein
MSENSSKKKRSPNRYEQIIEGVFFDNYRKGIKEFDFTRGDFEKKAKQLNVELPKNLGDVLYSFKFRNDFPEKILSTAPKGSIWNIRNVGRAKYRFRLIRDNPILPNEQFVTTKIPDSTPEVIAAYALGDEQALLAKVRYNRLVDIFLGITTFSLQNHLRTTVVGIGQIEIDEIYVGLDKHGRHFVVPVQAKGGNDKHSIVQTEQDIECCKEKFPNLICRAVSAQFMSDERIAMFELTVEDGEVKVVDERHYKLVPAKEISSRDLAAYRTRGE